MSSSQKTTIYFVVDATASMSQYLASLKPTLNQMFAMLSVLLGEVNIRIVVYRDFCTLPLLEHSPEECSNDDLVKFVSDLRASGGGDHPEALKTALHYVLNQEQLHQQQYGKKKALVILYTDAPPHLQRDVERKSSQNPIREHDELRKTDIGFDWVGICNTFHKQDIPVYNILSNRKEDEMLFPLLGDCLWIRHACTSDMITKVSSQLFALILGQDISDESISEERVQFSAAIKDLSYTIEEDLKPPKEATLPWSSCHDAIQTLEWLLPSSKSGKKVDLEHILVDRWRNEPQFQDVVFSSLTNLFSSTQGIRAVLYNPVIGKLWRLCCRNRLDERLDPLHKVFRSTTELLDQSTKEDLKEWIERSYDYSADYTALVKTLKEGDNTKCEDRKNITKKKTSLLPCLVLDPAASREMLPTRAELRSIGKSDVVEKVLGLPTHLMVLKEGDIDEAELDSKFTQNGVPLYIPLALKSNEVFAWMPHLINPGQWYSSRPAAVMALLCKLSGIQSLSGPADHWLSILRGGWIGLEKVEQFPEVVSPDYLTLMSGRLDNESKERYLSQWERQTFDRLYALYRIWLAATNTGLKFDVTTGFRPTGQRYEVRPDYLRKCISCGHLRSFTLMTELREGVCGVCCWARDEICKYPKVQHKNVDQSKNEICCKSQVLLHSNSDLTAYKHCRDCIAIAGRESVSKKYLSQEKMQLGNKSLENNKDVKTQRTGSHASHLVECRTCAALYALVHVDKLHCTPKCFYCRAGRKVPIITCRVCQNKFVCPDGDPGVPVDKIQLDGKPGEYASVFTCGTCAYDSARSFHIWSETTFKAILSVSNGAELVREICARTPWRVPLSAAQTLVDSFLNEKSNVVSERNMAYKIMTTQRLREKVIDSCDEVGVCEGVTAKDGVKCEDGGPGPNQSPRPSLSEHNTFQFKFKKKPVLNWTTLAETIRRSLEMSESQLFQSCQMCWQSKRDRALHRVCGGSGGVAGLQNSKKGGCMGLACADCMGKWYREQLHPGQMPLPLTHLMCPFCRLPASRGLIRHFHPQALMIFDDAVAAIQGECSVNRKFGWCRKCFKLKSIGGEEETGGCCALWNNTAEPINNFECEECVQEEDHNDLGDHKMCPDCKAPTFRFSGCPHLQCTQCQEHWCWLCGEGFGKEEDATGQVYAHIDSEHY